MSEHILDEAQDHIHKLDKLDDGEKYYYCEICEQEFSVGTHVAKTHFYCLNHDSTAFIFADLKKKGLSEKLINEVIKESERL